MYPITDALKKRFESGERKKAWITLSNASVDGLVITEEDIKADSFSIDRYCATGNKIEIGSAVSSEFSVVFNNSDGKFDGIVFEGSVLCVDVGFAHTTGNYVRCGFFTVDEPPRAFSTISIKGLDYMMLYDKTIDRTKLNKAFYTPEELVRSISELCGVEVSAEINFDALPNSAESLSIPTTATTYRQLLQWVAEITATCAYIGWDGKLRMSWFVDTPVNITPTLRYTGDVHENDIKITGVTVKTQDATATSGGDKYPLLIEDNGFVYSQTEQDRANNIGAVVNGFTYRPYECTCLPMPYLFPLDRITYTDKSGKEISTVVTNHRFGLNSTSILAAQGETQQKKNYAGRRGLTKAEVDSAIAEAMKNFDSSTEHFYVKYSAYEKGRDTDGNVSMFDKVQADTAYLGTCATDSKTPPEFPEDYNWVKIRPENGEPGRGVVSVKTQYYRSTSSTTQTGGSWTDAMPAWFENTYLWKREVVTYENPAETVNGTAILDTSWDVLGDIKEDASDAKEKASAVDVASKELNKTLAGALGLHLTEQTIAGSVVRYYHTNPTLSASKSGDTILVLNAQGFGVCKSGWNNGKPDFAYGTTFDGKAVWDILTANKISADLIEAGIIKSLATAGVQTKLDLATGVMTFDTDDTHVSVRGREKDDEVEYPAGISVMRKGTKDFFGISLNGLSYSNHAYDIAMLKYLLGTGEKPEDPYYSEVGEQHVKTKTVHCQDLRLLSVDGSSVEQSLVELLSTLGTTVLTLQQKIIELENKFGQQHEHIYTSRIAVNATCTSNGTRVYECACGESSYEESIPAIGHSDSNGDGYCNVCGAKIGTFYTIAVQSNNTDYGTVSGGGSNLASGSTIYINATPKSGYKFTQWSDGNTYASRTITVIGDATYIAYFEVDTSSGGSGDSNIGSDEVRVITSVGGGLAHNENPPCVADNDGVPLGADVIVKVNSGFYINAQDADGWVVSSVSVYVDGEFVSSVSSTDMGDTLPHDYWYFAQPMLAFYSGHTVEYKFYFEQA